jgi:membrane protease YdiL (CAAX protease family)
VNAADTRVRDWCAVAFASFFPLIMTTIYFVVLHDPEGNQANPVWMAAFGIGKFVQFSFPAAYVFWFERDKVRPTWPGWHGMPLGVGFGLVVGAGMFVLYYFFVRHIPSVSEQSPQMIWDRLVQFRATTTATYLALGFYICVLHSLGEEYYWRWFVFGWLKRHVPVNVAIVLAALGFMLHHVVILGVYFPGQFWTLVMPFSICVAVGGGVWSWIYDRTGDLWAPWVSHAIIDAAILGVGYVMLWDKW